MKRVIDSWVLAHSDRAGSWRVFLEALKSDLADIQGGTTAEGIHLGAMAGTVDLVQRGYTGIVTRGDTLWLNPRLPDGLACLRLTIRYRGLALDLEMARFSSLNNASTDVGQVLAALRTGEHQLQARNRFHLGERVALVQADAGAHPAHVALIAA